MRTAPLLVGLVIGFTAAILPACGPTMPPCSAATCALGCCDSAGKCQSATNSTCGRNGSSCSMCSVSESCVMGTCQSGNVGAGTAGGSAGGGNATGGGSSSSEYSAFLTTFSNAYCQKAIDCGSFPASAMADCQALLRQLFASYGVGFRTISTERSVLLGATAFDAVAAQRCLTDVAAFQCAGSSSLSDVCVNSVRPAAQTNGACFTSTDCVDSRLSCNGAPCSRRCIEGGNLGEGCKQGGICNAPFSCIDNVCRNDPAPGTPCQGFSSCGPRMTCTNSVCTLLPTNGQPCPGFRCAPEAYCDSTRVCRTKKTTGAACSRSDECTDDLRCSGTCGPKLGVGASCTSALDCQTNLTCNNLLRCAAKGAVGAACSFSDECSTGLECDDVLRSCQMPTTAGTGQPCSSARRCSSVSEQCRNVLFVTDGGANTAGTCGVPMLGDQCQSHFQCGAAQYCSMTARTCQAAGPSTPCSSESNCRPTDYCTSANTCAAKAASGQICDSTRSASCGAANELCLPTSTPGQSRCGRPPDLGQPCVLACRTFLSCVSGTCVAAGRVGQPCVDQLPTSCIAGECILSDGGVRLGSGSGGTCQAPRPVGAACSFDPGCQSGFCDRGGGGFSGTAGICVAACN